MFKVKKSYTFKRDVEVRWPDGSKGTLAATFKAVPHEELNSLLELPDVEFLEHVLNDTGPVGDENGNPLTTEEARAAVLADTCAVTACVAEYVNAVKVESFRKPKSGRRS